MITITKLRQDLFKFADLAAAGNVVEFTHKGVTLQLVPKHKMSKLSRLTPWKGVKTMPPEEFADASRQMSDEIMREWNHKWDKKLANT